MYQDLTSKINSEDTTDQPNQFISPLYSPLKPIHDLLAIIFFDLFHIFTTINEIPIIFLHGLLFAYFLCILLTCFTEMFFHRLWLVYQSSQQYAAHFWKPKNPNPKPKSQEFYSHQILIISPTTETISSPKAIKPKIFAYFSSQKNISPPSPYVFSPLK